MNKLTIDFETRSKCDLKKAGAFKYASDPSTEILCLAYKFNDGETLLSPTNGYLHDEVLKDHVNSADIVEAHNAQFEMCIWSEILVKRYGWEEIPLEKWRCSAAKAAALALPRSLDGLGKALQLPIQKDMKGHRNMLKMSKPRKPTKNNPAVWHEKPEDFERLYEYCKGDVETEHMASDHMPELIDSELQVFRLDSIINTRGAFVDLPAIDIAIDYLANYEKHLTEELREITNGEIKTANQVSATVKYLNDKGVDIENLTKESVTKYLEMDLPDVPRRVLEIRQALSKSSVKKLKSMKTMACTDSRIRGALLYHGASTGRWSGRGMQPQNYPRGSLKNVDLAFSSLLENDYDWFETLYPDVSETISSLLRSFICAAPGKKLIVADYAAIEARVLVWLVGDQRAIEIFEKGEDIYKDMASTIYKVPVEKVSKDQRNVGKTAILGLGYGMGHKKFKNECEKRGIETSKQMAEEVVAKYRAKYNKVKDYWYIIQDHAMAAIQTPGRVFQYRNIKFVVKGGYLLIKLPSGRNLAYRHPRIETKKKEWGLTTQITFMGVNSESKKWERQETYGGKLVENITQAVARDYMVHAMMKLEDKRYEIILTVHDEIIAEVDHDFGSVEEFESIMKSRPSWGLDCPIDVEGWEGQRYKK